MWESRRIFETPRGFWELEGFSFVMEFYYREGLYPRLVSGPGARLPRTLITGVIAFLSLRSICLAFVTPPGQGVHRAPRTALLCSMSTRVCRREH